MPSLEQVLWTTLQRRGAERGYDPTPMQAHLMVQRLDLDRLEGEAPGAIIDRLEELIEEYEAGQAPSAQG